jgi:hypothetical protein
MTPSLTSPPAQEAARANRPAAARNFIGIRHGTVMGVLKDGIVL